MFFITPLAHAGDLTALGAPKASCLDGKPTKVVSIGDQVDELCFDANGQAHGKQRILVNGRVVHEVEYVHGAMTRHYEYKWSPQGQLVKVFVKDGENAQTANIHWLNGHIRRIDISIKDRIFTEKFKNLVGKITPSTVDAYLDGRPLRPGEEVNVKLATERIKKIIFEATPNQELLNEKPSAGGAR